MINKVIPTPLKDNATLGFLSVSGSISDKDSIKNIKAYFEKLGFNVKISDTAYQNNNYLSGTDEQRANALNEFFADDSIDAIISMRGGYGALRILNKIDYEIIKNNPKIFCGYSDITALQLMIYKKTGLITYNGPMIVSDFKDNISQFTVESFFRVLKNKTHEIKIDNPIVFKQGKAKGALWGGNLSTIQSMCGLNFIPDEKFVFITEDINEPAYKIDKMFTQLLNIEKFKTNVQGIVLGDFTGVDNQIYLNDYIQELSNHMDIPIIGGLKFGHEKEKQTFPIGVDIVLNTDTHNILIN